MAESSYRGLFLLAQTPRAGKQNHCYIAPPGLPTALLYQVSADPAHYGIVVKQEVAQRDGRKGEEWLALIGVDKSALSPEKTAVVEQELRKILELPFEHWRRNFDWDAHPGKIVFLDNMQPWLRAFKGLPSVTMRFTVSDTPVEKKAAQPKRMPRFFLPVLALVVFGGLAGLLMSNFSKSEDSENQAKKTLTMPLPEAEAFCQKIPESWPTCLPEKAAAYRQTLYDFQKTLWQVDENIVTTARETEKTQHTARLAELGKWQTTISDLATLQKKLAAHLNEDIRKNIADQLRQGKPDDAIQIAKDYEDKKATLEQQITDKKAAPATTPDFPAWTATLKDWGYKDAIDFTDKKIWDRITAWLNEKSDFSADETLLTALAEVKQTYPNPLENKKENDKQLVETINSLDEKFSLFKQNTLKLEPLKQPFTALQSALTN